jgi:ribosomal protein S18 acetylase RimI-like enzyme
MPESGVRLARTPDVDDVAAINIRAWRQRFTDILPGEVLDSLDPGDLAMVWASGILNPPTPLHRLLVAVDAGAIVGYAAIGPSQDPDAEDSTLELLALEVDPDRQREGHGSRLMAAAVAHAEAAGMTDAATWCSVHDEARRAFLRSAGWGPDTAYRDVLVGVSPEGADVLVREARLVTALGDVEI